MIRALWDACVLLWILAHEVEDPEDGEERSFAALGMTTGERIATAACALPRNDREEAVA